MRHPRHAMPLAALLLAALAPAAAASPLAPPPDAPAWPAVVELHDALIELGPDAWIDAGHAVLVASPLDPDAPPLHLLSDGVLVVADGQAITAESASFDPATGVLESAWLAIDLATVRDPMPRPPGPRPPLPGPPERATLRCQDGEMIYNGRNIGHVDRERPIHVRGAPTWCNGSRISTVLPAWREP